MKSRTRGEHACICLTVSCPQGRSLYCFKWVHPKSSLQLSWFPPTWFTEFIIALDASARLSFFYLRNAEHLRYENEQRHLFEVNSFDHKDDVRLSFLLRMLLTLYTSLRACLGVSLCCLSFFIASRCLNKFFVAWLAQPIFLIWVPYDTFNVWKS